jgi:hypothetical protein
MAIRVRVSVLNGTEAVTENGSALMVTDSKAIARVEVGSLNKRGGLVVAAWIVVEPLVTTIRRRIWVAK